MDIEFDTRIGNNLPEFNHLYLNLTSKQPVIFDENEITINKFETTKDIDCSELPMGNYILHLDNGSEQVNKKMTIAR
jgi:hypothetical protein